MNTPLQVETRDLRTARQDTRAQVLAMMPLSERRLQLAGIETAVLEGGDGPPVILLHGAGEFAGVWVRVIPQLLRTHRVIVPDLPGHGASELGTGRLSRDRTLAWLGELIDHTCDGPPALVGHLLGGAIAARFATVHRDRLSHLVLVDSLGLSWFRPAPRFLLAMIGFMARPNPRTQDKLFRGCMVDLDGLRDEMEGRMALLEAYALERAASPELKAALRSLMPRVGVPPIPRADLARIAVPTTLIWGRHDLQASLRSAEAASARFGWPLHVIENAADDPAVEQPEAFMHALNAALVSSAPAGSGTDRP